MKIICDNKIPYIKSALEKFDVRYIPGKDINRDTVKNADALIVRTRTKCNAALLENSDVKFIASATIGYDHIDTDFCKNAGIYWTNAPGCNSSSVQQYIASAILSLAVENNLKINDLTLGIIGVGNVGKKIAKFADAIGLKIILNDPPRERQEESDIFSQLDTLLSESDIVTCHVPLNMTGVDKTYHLADSDFFSKMKNAAVLINSSRGEIHDTEDLKKALKEKIIDDAVIDVWENEPNIDLDLMNSAKFATPHIAGYSADGKANGTMMSLRALSRFFKLGMDSWKPSGIPEPTEKNISIPNGLDKENFLRYLLNSSYDLSKDNSMLRKNPSSFEKIRGNYPLRREFPAYNVILNNEYLKYQNILKKLGFKLNTN